jgi:hypothetical protein
MLCESEQRAGGNAQNRCDLKHKRIGKWLASGELNECELWHGACHSRRIDILSTD